MRSLGKAIEEAKWERGEDIEASHCVFTSRHFHAAYTQTIPPDIPKPLRIPPRSWKTSRITTWRYPTAHHTIKGMFTYQALSKSPTLAHSQPPSRLSEEKRMCWKLFSLLSHPKHDRIASHVKRSDDHETATHEKPPGLTESIFWCLLKASISERIQVKRGSERVNGSDTILRSPTFGDCQG